MEHTIMFTYESGGADGSYVFADIPGYFLWAEDRERLFNAIIPLAQHLLVEHKKMPMVPVGDLNIEELLHGTTRLTFKAVTLLQAPTIPVNGKWWRDPNGVPFFIPTDKEGNIPARIWEEVKESLNIED